MCSESSAQVNKLKSLFQWCFSSPWRRGHLASIKSQLTKRNRACGRYPQLFFCRVHCRPGSYKEREKENRGYQEHSVAGNRNHSSYFKQKGTEWKEAGVCDIAAKAGGRIPRAASISAISVQLGNQEAISGKTDFEDNLL